MKLLFITSSRIGDAVISTGVLKNALERYPGIDVTVAAAPLTLPLFEGVPKLSRLIPIKKQSLSRHWLRLWQECRRDTWDIIIDIRGSLVSYFLKSGNRYVWKSSQIQAHRVVQLGHMVGQSPAPAPHIWLRSCDIERANQLISQTTPVLGVAPAANWVGKQWPAPSFSTLIKQFLKNHKAKIAIFGAPQEREIIEEVLNAIPKTKRIDLVGNLSLLEIAACLKQCQVFVGNDSGLMHMAAAVKTPTIGLFGPSDDRLYAPYCPPDNPIHHVIRTPESLEELKKIPDFAFDARRTFMESLHPEVVYPVLERVWKGC